MKIWFARTVLISGLYDFFLAALFLFCGPFLSIFFGVPLDALSATLLQILGGCLISFGIALTVASRSLDQLIIIPVMSIPGRLIAFIVMIYYILLLMLPVQLVVFGIIDGVFGFLFVFFIFAIKEYSFRVALLRQPK